LLNGHGEILKFGGEVMKNVAGFDVSRFMVGALGTLGMVLDISMKVLPQPEADTVSVEPGKQTISTIYPIFNGFSMNLFLSSNQVMSAYKNNIKLIIPLSCIS